MNTIVLVALTFDPQHSAVLDAWWDEHLSSVCLSQCAFPFTCTTFLCDHFARPFTHITYLDHCLTSLILYLEVAVTHTLRALSHPSTWSSLGPFACGTHLNSVKPHWLLTPSNRTGELDLESSPHMCRILSDTGFQPLLELCISLIQLWLIIILVHSLEAECWEIKSAFLLLVLVQSCFIINLSCFLIF